MNDYDWTYEADDSERDEAADDARVLKVDVVEGGGAVPHPRVPHADGVEGDVGRRRVAVFVLRIDVCGGVVNREHGVVIVAAAVVDDGEAGRGSMVKMPGIGN